MTTTTLPDSTLVPPAVPATGPHVPEAPRTPRVQSHVDFLDSMRGFAILVVFLYHCVGLAFKRDQLEWDGWFRSFNERRAFLALSPLFLGWCGVAIFFVVSGYCIHLSWVRQREPSVKTFYIRRFFRIYPPYILTFLFFALVFPYTRLGLDTLVSWMQLFTHIFLVHNFHRYTLFGVNPPLWTVAIEFQLYLIFPLLLMMTNRIGWVRALWILAALEFGMRLIVGALPMFMPVRIDTWFANGPVYFWFSWAIGAAIADAHVTGKPIPFRRLHWVIPTILAVAAHHFRPAVTLGFPLFALATGCYIAQRLAGPVTPPKPRNLLMRYVAFAGVVSYSLYLIHQPLLRFVVDVFVFVLRDSNEMRHPLMLFGALVASQVIMVPLAYLCYRWVELPAIAMGKRLTAGK